MEMELKPTQAAPDPGRHAQPLFLFLGFFFSFSFSFFSDEHIFFSRSYFLLLWFSFPVVLVVFFVFFLDATWKKCHIRHEQPMKIESQKLDLQTLNRVSQTRNTSKNIVWEPELLTTQLGFYGHLAILAPTTEENHCADLLAKEGCSITDSFLLYSHPPSLVSYLDFVISSF